MTWDEHYRQAEALLVKARAGFEDSYMDDIAIAAQAHATLALAAAAALIAERLTADGKR